LHAVPQGRESPEGRLARWRLDRRVDLLARSPRGRRARATYGSPTSHDFLWPQLLEALQLTPDDRFLDVGCGGGALVRHVRDTVGCAVVAGVDHSRAMVKLAKPYAVHGDAEALPFADGAFTAIASVQMLMFCADPLAVLREMRRVGGRVAIWTTAPEGRGTPASPEPVASRAHYHTDEELLAVARAAGFGEARIAARDEWSQLLHAQP
jgi:ubiquinone/menaquinone biosynthesis C-methylase UbiE